MAPYFVRVRISMFFFLFLHRAREASPAKGPNLNLYYAIVSRRVVLGRACQVAGILNGIPPAFDARRGHSMLRYKRSRRQPDTAIIECEVKK